MQELEGQVEQARAHLAIAQTKLATLQSIRPHLIDLSLRENTVGSGIGQTLADKLAILPLVREFGFSDILLGTLDYAMPDELEVDDDFMMHLRDRGEDLRGCFAFTAVGRIGAAGEFVPDPSQLKLARYGVPNTLHEIYLSDLGMRGQYDFESLCGAIVESIRWLHEHVVGEPGRGPRILVNIVDGCDAFAQDPERTFRMLALLAQQPIEGVSLEDDRGTYLPFQVGAFVAAARALLPPPLRILVHIHAGAGFENASALEALVSGADGVWGGLPKRAATIGHASLGELIANLVRVGNPNPARDYRLDRLLPLARRLQRVDDEERGQDDLPILGANAYRLTLSFFEQIEGRPMDLPPEKIGGHYGYRICPVVSDARVIAGRLAEVTGCAPESFAPDLLAEMIRTMRRDLRAGIRIDYDRPANLRDLHARALRAIGCT